MNRFDNHRRATLCLLLAGAAATLAACGKVGSPVPPPDADPRAQRFYPADPRRFEKRDPIETETPYPEPAPDAFPPPVTPPPNLYPR